MLNIISNNWVAKILLCFAAFMTCFLLVSSSEAASGDSGSGSGSSNTNDIGDMGEKLCDILNAITAGPVGKSIAMIAVIALGISIFLGKISWGLALATVVGIILIFSSGTIVNTFGDLNGGCQDAKAKSGS